MDDIKLAILGDKEAKGGVGMMNGKPCDQLNGVTLEGFRLGRCNADEMCRNYSPWGNYCYIITDDNIEALKTGRVLYDVDEYGTFLIYQPSRKEAGPC